jgi:hypothetical protein
MRYLVLASDYDGTLAHHGQLDEPTIAALERLRSSGRRILLVTGRELADLQRVCEGDLKEGSFIFRGPEGKLNLHAQNLMLFLQLADGVDDETWLFHLRQGDYAAWFAENVKDAGLAEEAAQIADDQALDARTSRARMRAAIERRYTAPA